MINGKKETYIATSNETYNIAINPKINNSRKIGNIYTSNLKYTFAMEPDDDLAWFGIDGGGLMRYAINTDVKNTFTPQKDSTSLASHIVLDILRDSRKRIWIATANGVSMLTATEKKELNPTFKNFQHETNDSTSLSNNYAVILFETSQQKSNSF